MGLSSSNTWVKINLGQPTMITAIGTQGRSDAPYYTETYRIVSSALRFSAMSFASVALPLFARAHSLLACR